MFNSKFLRITLSRRGCIFRTCKSNRMFGTRGLSTSHTILGTSTLSDFHLKKLTQEFDFLYDTNKDGYIDKKDIEGFKGRMKHYLQIHHGKALKRAYDSTYDHYWSVLQNVVTTDRRGRISREAWINLWEKVVNNAPDASFKSLPQWVQIMPRGIYPVLDYDRNGCFDTYEYRDFWHEVGRYPKVDDKTVTHIFDILTEGGKYKMDLARTEQLYADFYLSNDPTTPGRYIGGPVDYSHYENE